MDIYISNKFIFTYSNHDNFKRLSECFKKKTPFYRKHLSIISFRKDALIKYSSSKKTNLEKIEDIELLRAIEIGLKIKTIDLKGDSFSIDVYEDFLRAKDKFKSDKIFKKYI